MALTLDRARCWVANVPSILHQPRESGCGKRSEPMSPINQTGYQLLVCGLKREEPAFCDAILTLDGMYYVAFEHWILRDKRGMSV
jgi:hypothetical protein